MDKMRHVVVSTFTDKCYNKALNLCKTGKYRHNRNPTLAALYDPDLEVRIGATMLIVDMKYLIGVAEGTITILRDALSREKEDLVKLAIKVALNEIAK